MLWNVKNALSRDVEREHLNKILAEIRLSVDDIYNSLSTVQGTTGTDVEAIVGRMVYGNQERGIQVIYNPGNKKLDFTVNQFTITLEGPVTGQGVVTDLNDVTIQTDVSNAGFVTDAPNDNTPYWRISQQWQQVPQPLWQMETLSPAGLTVLDDEYIWHSVQLESNTARITISNADGVAGNPFIDLATVTPTTVGTLQAITVDGYGRVTGSRAATITGTSQQIDVANGTAAAGLPTISLADLPNSGVGAALVKITRDAKGRLGGTSSATTNDLTEGASNLYFTIARVLATALTGLSTATSTAITAADTVLSAFGKAQAQITSLGTLKADKATFTGYITGMMMSWVSGTSITVSTGGCYIPSLAYVLAYPSAITKSGLTLSASTWYHVYAYLNGATPDIEIVTTAPSATYSGDARTKTGDTSRRYIGSLRTDAAAAIISFVHSGDSIKYTNNVINNIVLNAGNSTTLVSVDISGYCPVTSRIADALCYNSASTASGAFTFFSNSEAVTVTSSAYLAACAPVAYLAIGLLMDSTQKITYLYNTSPGGGGSFVRIMGYRYAR